MDEINQKMKILIQNRIFAGRPECPGGLPDKSRKPYWNPVKKDGHIRCPKSDTPVYQTGYFVFG
jgi:hypothetical protein